MTECDEDEKYPREVLNSYIEACRDEDIVLAASCWAKDSLRRFDEGFDDGGRSNVASDFIFSRLHKGNDRSVTLSESDVGDRMFLAIS
ncbi:hypothetical protein JIN85_04680 [Luteolibacter pohnpeiensis]|uniref:Uncharacterized protein n=1 Tax=Luteolibacter pohnpeiensis TaxID=454153 RepID=A0A934S3B2_9BACT|nr:hypothetical protein [Luteolibacter pohnpeiensis]